MALIKRIWWIGFYPRYLDTNLVRAKRKTTRKGTLLAYLFAMNEINKI